MIKLIWKLNKYDYHVERVLQNIYWMPNRLSQCCPRGGDRLSECSPGETAHLVNVAREGDDPLSTYQGTPLAPGSLVGVGVGLGWVAKSQGQNANMCFVVLFAGE